MPVLRFIGFIVMRLCNEFGLCAFSGHEDWTLGPIMHCPGTPWTDWVCRMWIP